MSDDFVAGLTGSVLMFIIVGITIWITYAVVVNAADLRKPAPAIKDNCVRICPAEKI